MSDVTEYFVRRYTLVLNNDEGMYKAVRERVKQIMRMSSVTLSEYLAMTDEEREKEFAQEIGNRVLTMIEEWWEEAICNRDHPGVWIVKEAMMFSGGDLAYALGKSFLPENGEADEYLYDVWAD